MSRDTDDTVASVGPPALGTTLLAAGVALVCLRAAQDAAGLPFGMPGFWYRNGALWYLLGAALAAAGIVMLRERRQVDDGWRPTHRGLRFRSVVLYTRPGCHLCEEAAEILARYRRWLPAPAERNIDDDKGLVEKFGTCVPVVECDGRVRFRGRINEVLLRRLIEGTPPLDTRPRGAVV